MKNESIFSEFTNLYSVSKTLRFELLPVGETLNHIKEKGLLAQDKQRASDYEIAKKIIDEYHKNFIEESLSSVELTALKSYFDQYNITNKDDKQKKEFEKTQENLRKEIAISFTNNTKWNNLLKKELIKADLIEFLQDEIDKAIIKKFNTFTTYFTGFNENRKNMYSNEDKAGSIAFRLVHQNLPKFIDNIKVFSKVNENNELNNSFKELLENIKPSLNKLHFIQTLDEVFTIDFYNHILTQKGIDDFNIIIGGFTTESKKEKIKGLNEYINLFNQQQTDKKNKLPKCKVLFKQILSEKNTISFLPEKFKEDAELLESIEKYYQEINENILIKSATNKITLENLLQNLKDYDLNNIYLKNDTKLTNIAQQMFGDWSVFQEAIKIKYEIEYPKKDTKKWEEDKEKSYKKPDSFSIQFLQECLDNYKKDNTKNIIDYFASIAMVENDNKNKINLLNTLQVSYHSVEDILKGYDKEKDLMKDKEAVQKIKLFLDNIKNIQRFIKPLLGDGKETEKDNLFYAEFERIWNLLKGINKLYDKVRNYITKKPYSTEKIKLNFENSTLLNGWDLNKEPDNTAVLFKKNNLYYLGIMNRKFKKIFKKIEKNTTDDYYQKIIYKLLPGANKMLPKVFFSKKNIQFFNPSDEIVKIRNHSTHTKNGKPQKGFQKKEFNINDCRKMIDFFIQSLNKHTEWKEYNFIFKHIEEYNTIDEFYRDVENKGFKISFTNIDEIYINSLVADGKLYLFQIYNKDFSEFSKGKPNLHTMYWKILFDENNLQNIVYKLNGQAEIFYRELSIKKENIIDHKANQILVNKNKLNPKKESKFNYDIIKDKRFTTDKFQFHVPITMNFKANGYTNINQKVLDLFKQKNIEHIIGIDRGERHLIYISVIDINGNIKEQYSLNEIINNYKGIEYPTNFHLLLDSKESTKKEAQLSWKTIENIKELKEGYISQVIHKITNLMKQYNAIVVLEDLNAGFMRGRQKVDKQIYQKFEKMLIDKLNYYVDKDKFNSGLGGLLKALQLSSKFESFEKLGKQSGFLFYVPAFLTSKIDPTSGFVNLLYPKYETIKQAQEFLNKFESIQYNSQENHFEFSITNLNSFNPKAAGTQQNWTICTNGIRLENFRNKEKNYQWDTKDVKLTNEFKKLLDENNIHYVGGNCIKYEIVQINEAKFFKDLFHLLKLTLQIRNNRTGTDEDFLLSCVKNKDGYFYDSRDKRINQTLPENADANGAYNIARKGLMLIKRVQGELQKYDDKEKVDEKNKLVISNKEWLQFAQENN